jgi:hypothetical protein
MKTFFGLEDYLLFLGYARKIMNVFALSIRLNQQQWREIVQQR